MRLLETSVMIYMKMKFWGGESGSGLFHLAIMGLLPAHISKISEGALFFKGIMLQTERKGIAPRK
jgi:ABC-type dipeptide/oligopeptide/nickel transport system ATPase component